MTVTNSSIFIIVGIRLDFHIMGYILYTVRSITLPSTVHHPPFIVPVFSLCINYNIIRNKERICPTFFFVFFVFFSAHHIDTETVNILQITTQAQQ